MTVDRVQKFLTLSCLCFIGFFFIMAALPVTKMTREGGVGSPRPSPTTAVVSGDLPFNSEPLLHESGFDVSNWWNYSSSPNVNASWSSGAKRGYFNHTSPPSGSVIDLSIDNATYNGNDVTDKVADKDSITLRVDEGALGGHRIFNIFFSYLYNFKDGDVITLYVTSGNPCHIYVRDVGSQSDPTYGIGYYSGNTPQTVNITLSGITSPRSSFNLDIDFAFPTQGAYVDQVMGWWAPTPKIFEEDAYINQTILTPALNNVSYNLQCTGNVSAFQNVQSANISVQINQTIFWSKRLTNVFPDTAFSIQLPHNLLQKGGSFALVFHLRLSVYSAAAVDFKFYIDDVFLNQTPNTNLLDDSPCIMGTPWNMTASAGYYGMHNPQYELLQFYTTGTIDGGVRITQSFNANSSRTNYTLVFNYLVANLTNVNHMNITVCFNNTQVGTTLTLNQTSTTWSEFRVNATTLLSEGQDYLLNITLAVKINTGSVSSLWGFGLDNIFLYPNWDSSLARLGAYDPDITAGQVKDISYQYNASGQTSAPVRDANIVVFNNDTGLIWGADRYGNSKYQVINIGNGTYTLKISTVGFSVGLYNLVVVFYRPNFPDTTDFIQLNIVGSSLDVIFSAGAHWNDTNQIWFIDEDNLPYVDDTTKVITIYVADSGNGTAITNAFVEAALGPNSLSWWEVYKGTGNPADVGYYDVFLDTTGLNPYTDYLLLNFSIRVTAEGYSAQTVDVTTIVNPLPTMIAVPAINPFYEGSTLDVVAIFQDTFHGTGIDYATITWEVVSQPFSGLLDFVFLGFYEGHLSLTSLDPGNYTLRLVGSILKYANATLDQPIEVLPKYNVTILATYPANFMEGNAFRITYNLTYTELGGPVVGESVNFFVNYSHGVQQNYNLFTGGDGLITITLNVPMGETEVNITVTYGGKTNVSSSVNSRVIPVIERCAVILEIQSNNYPAELVGGTDVEIDAMLTYANGTPVVGATLIFSVSTSQASVVTDGTGVARAFVTLPTAGNPDITVTFEGTPLMKAASAQGVQLNVISPATAFMNQVIQYVIYGAIIFAIVVGLYVGASRGVVRPRQRARQAEYVGLMNRFEDARNIQLLMLINRESGTEIYSKALSGVPVDPTLVSGFLQAITSFGKELLPEEKVESMQGPKTYLARQKGKAQTQILEFHHFKILLEETRHLRVALLLLKNPSQRLLNALHKFSERSETRFGAGVEGLHGRLLTDDETWELIDDTFEPSLIYVHMVDLVNARTIIPTRWEKVVLDEIQRAPFLGEAYLDTLQEQVAHRHIGKELEIVAAGLALRRKNVLLALSPRYMEVRVTIKKAIDALPSTAKLVILAIGDGETDVARIVEQVNIPRSDLASIVQQLQELGILTDKGKLDMPGKLVYTTLKVGAEKP